MDFFLAYLLFYGDSKIEYLKTVLFQVSWPSHEQTWLKFLFSKVGTGNYFTNASLQMCQVSLQ